MTCLDLLRSIPSCSGNTMSTTAIAITSAQACMYRTKQTYPLQSRDPAQLTPREVRVKHVMATEPWKLTAADTTEDPDEYFQLTGSRTCRGWLEYSNRERRELEKPEWRMDAEWLHILARRSWPPENRAAERRRVDEFIQHRIDWYVDAEEELAAWNAKVARIRGSRNGGSEVLDDEANESYDRGNSSLETEEESKASSSLEAEQEVKETVGRIYRPSKFVECLCARDNQAGHPVRCGVAGGEKLKEPKQSEPFLKELVRRTRIFWRAKQAHRATQIPYTTLVGRWAMSNIRSCL